MLADYKDIISKLGKPVWYDEVGCPRYCKFEPKRTNNIYSKEAVLLLIRCQACHEQFKVCLSEDLWSLRNITADYDYSLLERIISGAIHYGDPPRHDYNKNCIAGSTMNCEDIKVLEYWSIEDMKWIRDRSLEIRLPDGQELC
jgi:hypothetical protein